MPAFSYKKAASFLTEKEKERLACIYLTTADEFKLTGKHYAAIGSELGMSKHSVECFLSSLNKKLRANDCERDGGEGDGAPATPASTPKPKGRKRKADGDIDAGEEKTAKAKRARGKKSDSAAPSEIKVEQNEQTNQEQDDDEV